MTKAILKAKEMLSIQRRLVIPSGFDKNYMLEYYLDGRMNIFQKSPAGLALLLKAFDFIDDYSVIDGDVRVYWTPFDEDQRIDFLEDYMQGFTQLHCIKFISKFECQDAADMEVRTIIERVYSKYSKVG